MKKRFVSFLLAGLMCLSLTGCGINLTGGPSSKEKAAAAEKAKEAEAAKAKLDAEKVKVIEYIKANVKAMNDENVDAYMKDFQPGTSSYDDTKTAMEQVFKLYDLKVELEKIEVESIDEKTAKVYIVQTTKKISGPAFNNNRMTAYHYLVKNGDRWYIQDTQVVKADVIQ